MRKPFSYMAAGLVVMGQAGTAAALGLGEIELQSALNQPLSANIRLLQADGLASDEILITLATPAEFERAGIDRPALLSELRFVIATDAEGRRVIRVSSREPMREPYLDFLLEVQWPQGKMMREFTLLLDPPGYVMKQPVTPPAVRTAPVVMPAASAPAAAPTPRPTPSEPAPASEGGGLHRVGSAGNTLWAIAKAVRPSSEVTLQQTMMALRDLNPQAFVDGDINRLKRGALLQVPSLDQIRQRSASAAAQAVAVASQQRRQAHEGVPAPALTTTAPAPAVAAKAPDAELKLVAPSAPETKPAQVAAGNSKKESATTEELNQKLALTLENLDRLIEENKELKARQDEIGQQLQTMQKLLNLKDEQLAGLQAKLAAEQSVEAKPAAEAAAPQDEQGLLARLLAEPLYLAASAAAVGVTTLLAVLGLRRRAAQRQAVDAYPADDFMFDDSSVPVAAASVAMVESASTPEPAPSMPVAPQSSGPRTEPVAPRAPETADPLTEADIYLAYGRHEPAIALLTGAIEREPDRSDFWLKLLEIHAERKDRTAFDAAKQKIDALGDPLAIQRAAELKMTLGGAAVTAEPELFAFTPAEPVEGGIDFSRIALDEPPVAVTAQIDVAPAAAMAPLDFDLAGSLEVPPSTFAPTAPVAEPTGRLPELEFEPGLFAPQAEPPAVVESAAGEAGEIDFEFDFGSLEPPAPLAPGEVVRAEDFDLATPLADVVASVDDEDMDLDTLHMRMREEMAARLAAAQPTPPVGEEEDLDSLHRRAREEMQQLLASDLAGSAPGVPAVEVPHPVSEPLFRPHAESDGGFEDETFNLLAGTDENATRLDLARAYLDMGNHDGARELIDEVLLEGDPQQQDEARALLFRLG